MIYSSEYWDDVSRVIDNIPNIKQLYKKRILITGATGMVCSAIVDLLVFLNHKHNFAIQLILAGRDEERIIKRFDGALNSDEFEYIFYDATKIMNLNEQFDYVIHGASNANPSVYSYEPVETLFGNICGVRTLLESARANPDSRVLFISSSEVYGNKKKNSEFFKEDDYGFVDILNPRACYPNGKRAAETLCVSYGQEYAVDTVIVRLGHIYGPSITESDSRASAAFTRDVLSGRNIIMKSAGTQIRSYCYTLDCAAGILTVLLNGKTGNAYNLSNRNSVVSIRDLAQTMADIGGVQVIFENPSDAEKKSYNPMSNSSLNANKLEQLGWKAIFGLKHGIQQTIKFSRQ